VARVFGGSLNESPLMLESGQKDGGPRAMDMV
jgi:hypothetical protein